MSKRDWKQIWIRFSLLFFIMMAGMVGPVEAQPPGGGRGGPGGGPGEPPGPRFNPQDATTITGQVENLGSYGLTGWRATPGMAFQRLVLKTPQGDMEVFLGPPWYVAKQGFSLKQNDTLEVVGFKTTRGNQTIFLAARVKKNGQTLKLLDEHGVPLWRGQGPDGQNPGRPGPGGPGPGGMGPEGMERGGGGPGSW